MLVISNECSEYVDNIISNFIDYTQGVKKLERIEKNRQEKIRSEIVALIKLYKGVELSKREKDVLDKRMFQYDLKTDLNRCIYQVAYEISDKVCDKVFYITIDNMRNYSFIDNSGYNNYLKALKKYRDSLLHAMCCNHQVILTDLSGNQLNPVMNFDSECFFDRENTFIGKVKVLKKHNKKTLN